VNGINSKQAFLGAGWAFPVCDTEGQIDVVGYEQDIHQAIRIILGTNFGERIMRENFGAGLNDFVFLPVTATTLERIRVRVEESLIDWEPRIDVEEVTVTSEPIDRATVLIDVRYRIRSTNTQANLVYPFYLEEGSTQ
jgi:hypothetical protein